MNSQTELRQLVTNLRRWVRDHLEDSHPEQAEEVKHLLFELHTIASRHPDQAEAALVGAKTIWYMLREDAWKGFGSRHERKPLPKKADAETIKKYLDQAHKDNPGKNVTALRAIVAGKLEMGRSTLLNKTTYNPIKK